MTSAAVEVQIQNISQTKRIRPSEFFLDFDRLRSGSVSEKQFFRVLWENLGIKLTEEQEIALARKYASNKKDGRMNYRAFCDIINQPFDPNNLSSNPSQQKVDSVEFLGTQRSLHPLSPGKEKRIETLLRSLEKYYAYRGINLRTCCEDFDLHHIGVIQESQFYRSFPRPPEVSEEDVTLLVTKYRDPDRPGLLNYLNLHHDLVVIGQRISTEEMALPEPTQISDILPPEPGADTNLQQIFDRIRVAVYKNRVRSIEFFKDFDKLRSGMITVNQFVCGLSLAISKEAQLSRSEIQKVVEFYRTEDGRVRYKEFCDMMENAFNVPDLEKKPTLEVTRPTGGALGRNLPCLSKVEEERVVQVLQLIADQVRKRRLMMYQYFKDYDRSEGYSRVVTPTQFGRILHFLSLNVASEDLKLLCNKFADLATGDVNYPAFVQTVDREFINYTQDAQRKPESKLDSEKQYMQSAAEPETSNVSLDDLLARIRNYVLANSLRVCEFFQDFDTLRSGKITKSQFCRGLSDLGLSALGQHYLNNAQFNMIANHYEDPQMPDNVLWTKFRTDIDSVFTQPNLEKTPCHQVPPVEIFKVPKPGTMDWKFASEEHKVFFEQVMERLRNRANQRRILAKPVFQDFDKHNNGHVTRAQFRQCLTMLKLQSREDEMQALEAKFCNDTGFNYIAFLQELQPIEPPRSMYVERLKTLRLTNQKAKLPEGVVAKELESVLIKIKTKVFKERIQIIQWMRDGDKLRSGRLNNSNFRRALDLCKFELAESELAILEDEYSVQDYPGFVDYVRFSDEIESVFTTKNLEKNPLLDVATYSPPVEWQQNVLDPEMENSWKICMERLAEQVRKNRIQLFPLFEDYDRVHNGTVSRSQFRRVLSELELACLVATEYEWVCLFQKYDVRVGGKEDFYYNAFCDTLYELARFEWRKP